MVAYPFNFAMLSHTGRVRKGNEDTCAASIEAGAFVVCDGMGGAAAGEVASSVAAETFLEALEPHRDRARASHAVRLEHAVHVANQAVYQQAKSSSELRGMGTTLVALLLAPDHDGDGAAESSKTVAPTERDRTALTLVHVGDSRCYRFRAGELEQLTADHSLVEEQVRAGEMTPYQASRHPWRNIITRAIGSQPVVEAEIQRLDPRPGDLYLLASDGLTRELTEADIAGTIRAAYQRETGPLFVAPPPSAEVGSVRRTSAGPGLDAAATTGAEVERIRENVRGFDLAALCQRLIDQANEAGGGDNITVLLLAIK